VAASGENQAINRWTAGKNEKEGTKEEETIGNQIDEKTEYHYIKKRDQKVTTAP